MQVVNSTIGSRTAGATNAPLFLINTDFTGGKSSVTSKTISKICSVAGCGRQLLAGELCAMHRARLRRNGGVDILKNNVGIGDTRYERFWSKIDRTPGLGPNGDCWLWIGCADEKGYGRFEFRRKKWFAHRLAWAFAKQAIPQEDLLHSCDTPSCCNPDHLREGTQAENVQDAIDRGRFAIGSKSGVSVINEAIAAQVKRHLGSGKSPKVVAEEIGIAKHIVQDIKRGQTWRHVEI